jgi:hypothetical protein
MTELCEELAENPHLQDAGDFGNYPATVHDDYAMKHRLDPNQTFTRRDVKKAVRNQADDRGSKNYETEMLCDFIKTCYEQPQGKRFVRELRAQYEHAGEENTKLGNAVARYVDLEKVQAENMRNEQAKRREQQKAAAAEDCANSHIYDFGEQSRMLSVKNQ